MRSKGYLLYVFIRLPNMKCKNTSLNALISNFDGFAFFEWINKMPKSACFYFPILRIRIFKRQKFSNYWLGEVSTRTHIQTKYSAYYTFALFVLFAKSSHWSNSYFEKKNVNSSIFIVNVHILLNESKRFSDFSLSLFSLYQTYSVCGHVFVINHRALIIISEFLEWLTIE